MRRLIELGLCVAVAVPALAAAQAPSPAPTQPAPSQPAAPAANPAQAARARMSRPVVLQPDDVPAFPEAPDAIFERREAIPHGTLELIEYDSKTVGTRRKMNVYTPPGYSKDKKYPVVYLLHGIGGDETEWMRFAHPAELFDNLIADGKMVPLVAVFPNGRAQKNDRAEGNAFASAPAFAVFERDLLRRRDPGDRIALFGEDGSGEPRPRRAVDGRRADAELRAHPPRSLRLDRRVLLGAEHEAAGRSHPRPGRRDAAAQAAVC